MITKSILSDLESIVNKGLENSLLPYAKGNSIRIKNMVVRYNPKKGYMIYDTLSNTQVARVQFKSTALGIAKCLAAGKNHTKKLLDYDKELLKHYNDAVFYKNIISKTKDKTSAEVRAMRLDISLEKTRSIRDKIDKFIFAV